MLNFVTDKLFDKMTSDLFEMEELECQFMRIKNAKETDFTVALLRDCFNIKLKRKSCAADYKEPIKIEVKLPKTQTDVIYPR